MRLDDQRARDGGAFFHAAGKFARHLVHGVFQADGGQHFRDNFFNLFRRFEPVFRQIQTDVFADGERIEQRAGLEDERHAIFRRDFRRGERFAVDENFAGVRFFQADEMFEQNTLAAAARPHDDKNLAGLHFDVHALEHFLIGKTFAQAAHDEADAGIVVLVLAHFSKKRVRM